MNAPLTACVALLLAAAAAAAAEDRVYRCGSDGREYSHAPCPSGTAVDVADPRTAEQRREAKSASARDARMAQDLIRERRARETSVASSGAAYLGPVRVGAAESAAARHKHKRKAGHEAGEDSRLTPPLRIAAERR
jgi:hypothetical protein